MRAIKIDPVNRTVTEIDIDGHYPSMVETIGGIICYAHDFGNGHYLYVDDEGLLKEPTMFFNIIGSGHRGLTGIGLIIKENKRTEENISATIGLDTVKKQIHFFEVPQGIEMYNENETMPDGTFIHRVLWKPKKLDDKSNTV